MRFPSKLATMLLCTIALAAPSLALAQESAFTVRGLEEGVHERKVVIRFGDLDPASNADAAILAERIDRAAREGCNALANAFRSPLVNDVRPRANCRNGVRRDAYAALPDAYRASLQAYAGGLREMELASR